MGGRQDGKEGVDPPATDHADGLDKKPTPSAPSAATAHPKEMIPDPGFRHRPRLRSPWSCSPLTAFTTFFAIVLLITITRSFLTTQIDPKGCLMSYMRPAFGKCEDFDTEHTHLASKYSLYLYREGGIDEDTRVRIELRHDLPALTLSRSRASLSFSSPVMQAATNKSAQSPQKPPTTSTTSYSMIRQP